MVPEKQIFKGLLPDMEWRPSWSYYQDRLNKLSFPQPIEVDQLAKPTFCSPYAHTPFEPIEVDQLAKPTFCYPYAHTPFGSAPVPILLS